MSTLDCCFEEKKLVQVMKRSCGTVQQTWGQVGWAPQIPNHYLETQALVSPIKSFSNSL